MAEDDNPAETLKRATSACLRAIAEREDVTVSFGGEPPGVAGTRARLPAPSRLPTAEEVAKMRGAADAIALRLRHHDAELHAARMPKGEDARAAFEALEQARCEAIGASQMVGVADNLSASLEERYRRQGYARMTERDQAPLTEMVRLIAREALTGAVPPSATRKVVNLWRKWFNSKVSQDFGRLSEVMEDQEAYAERARQLLTDLGLAVGVAEQP